MEKKQEDALKRRDGVSGSDLSELIHGKFESYSENFRHNVDQNINNDGNIDEDEATSGSGGFGGFGGSGGFAKAKRQFGFGGYGGGGGGGDGGAFDDNENQNINQNVNANQNLMANLGRFNSFFGQPSGGMMGSYGAASNGLSGLGFGNNENTDFNVNNNVAFEDTGFFKNKRSLDRRQFGFGDSGTFSDNGNQNINQNINNNQNLNEDFFSGVFPNGGGGGGGGFDNGYGFVPLFFGSGGGFGGSGGYGGGFSGGNEMNENFNFNPDVNGNNFGGSGFVKRSPCGSQGCGSSGFVNSNVNTNTVQNSPIHFKSTY